LSMKCQCMSPQFSLSYGLTTQNLLIMPSSSSIILRLMLLAWKGLFKSTNDILPACLAGYHICLSNYKQGFGNAKGPLLHCCYFPCTPVQLCISQLYLHQSSVMHDSLAHVGAEASKCTDHPHCIPVLMTT